METLSAEDLKKLKDSRPSESELRDAIKYIAVSIPVSVIHSAQAVVANMVHPQVVGSELAKMKNLE